MLIKPLEKIEEWFCGRRYRSLILRALDGHLDLRGQARLAAHLKTCARRRARYDRQAFAAQMISRYALPGDLPAGNSEWARAVATRGLDAKPRWRGSGS